MPDTAKTKPLANGWDDTVAAQMSEPEKLLYRSNLLGSDMRITNFGGGNTSAKVTERDPVTGEEVEVLWVKGSGGDLGSMKLDGFATLYMDKLAGPEGCLPRARTTRTRWWATCRTAPSTSTRAPPRSTRRCTPMCRSKHVDHMHPDAVIAIAAAKNSKELTQEIYGGEIGWLPWKRPGYELGLVAGEVLPGEPRRKRRGARKPRAVHLGRRRQGVLRADPRDHPEGAGLVRGEDRGRSRLSAAPGTRASTPPPAAPWPPS